jgi:hypothetical protein
MEEWLYESLTRMSCEFQLVNMQNRLTQGQRAPNIVQYVVQLSYVLFFIPRYNSPY